MQTGLSVLNGFVIHGQLLHYRDFMLRELCSTSVEGYPVFLPLRSMVQAESVETLEWLAGGWKYGWLPNALVRNLHKYIHTLEGDIAERDRLIDAICLEPGSTKSENNALRQEVAALKKAILEGRALPMSLPPAPLSPLSPLSSFAPQGLQAPHILGVATRVPQASASHLYTIFGAHAHSHADRTNENMNPTLNQIPNPLAVAASKVFGSGSAQQQQQQHQNNLLMGQVPSQLNGAVGGFDNF
ncbi:hypothetical protein DFH11DRAFT_1732018 [Phellopilus nigrolimitatus]|nr:hypothetical protein DFH11DRAFT_1732018 [Phellopilus nigrolimitatus]